MYDILPYDQWHALSAYMQSIRKDYANGALPNWAAPHAVTEQGYRHYLIGHKDTVCPVPFYYA